MGREAARSNYREGSRVNCRDVTPRNGEKVAPMAQILFPSFLLSVLLLFHEASGDSGWVISPYGLEQTSGFTQNYISTDLCKPLLRIRFGHALPEFLSAGITECNIVSVKMVLKPKIGLHVFASLDLLAHLGPFLYVRVEVSMRLALHIGRHGMFVHGCSIVDAVIKGRGHLTTDMMIHVALDALVRVLSNPMCEKAKLWCRDLNYCLDFVQYPFPITPSCYGVWRNQPPLISESQIELRSQPVCTCKEMTEGLSVSIDATVALRIAVSPTEQSIYFCHERDVGYIFECMRRGGVFNDMSASVSLTVGSILERIPTLVFSCPRTANIVIKFECTRMFVEMQPGYALLCLRYRVNVGCDLSNFTSPLTFTMNGCFNLFLVVNCRKELLLPSVSARNPLRFRNRCTEGEECELDEGALAEIFRGPLTSWCVSHINAKIKNGFRIPFLRYYPCDKCEKTIYVQDRVYCPCTLNFVPK